MTDREKPPLEGPLDQYMASDFSALEEERVWAKVRARRDLRAKRGTASGVILPTPIGDALLDEHALQLKVRARLWREVRARVHRPQRRYFRVALTTALLGAVTTCALLFFALRPPAPSVERAAPTALLVADGRPFIAIESGEQARTVTLGDASEIRMAPFSRVEPLSSSGSRFEVLLARGSAEFSVTPGGPRRWLVEAGAARVEVLGTVFRVTRASATVRVSVSRGTVLVRGENVPGWVQRLKAGEHLTVQGKQTPSPAPAGTSARLDAPDKSATPAEPVPTVAALSAPEPPAEPALRTAAAPRAVPAPVQHASSNARVRSARHKSPVAADELAPELSPAERYAALGPAGLARATMSASTIDQLLELADIARLSGHPQDAVAPLTRALEAFPNSRQAALAAFTLGRVLLDQLDAAAPAADAFERALVLGLPKGLRADCYRRLSEAYERSKSFLESARANARLHDELKSRVVSPGEAAP